ncbi:MAG TPA: D-alanyl-D-alanine carboxypeptidase/D-alanyl-D-alanine-endopeptidase [Actinophytocola sp.]|uniref:D-alanyl-D-alanine carboxypeptidase/D-alanyl-D-alanine endopeptidase n=1 Tax=Actinophytocola sp. TaxID=1872138 RepID=UPI002DBB7E01|nr:D-alanyl-D-alanine carboxypeptidase/D-alanyl-D-alanine-endopeptidase [Actinophytocola sp.]HEU5471851.1 D-alanyl-D-alanine carboxypeptidase/D-alanyl-D-alanine-endopeptidase [Actinophytocola sp.]
MPEHDGDGQADAAWPQVDDDESAPAPADAPTRRIPVPPPADEITRHVPRPPQPVADVTHRIPIPPPGPSAPPAPHPDQRFTGVIPIPAAWGPEPQRAVPMRIPPQPELQVPPPRPGRRRTALLVAAALVVAVGAGAGVVFGVPGVARTLGLTDDEPEVVISPPAAPVQFAPALKAPGDQVPAPTPAGVRTALAGPVANPALGTLTGTVLDPVSGTVLWEQGADTALVPASTGKILTAAAALLALDHTEQLTTTVVAGKDPGSVVIIGGGDPTLSALKAGAESVYPGAARLDDLVAKVKTAAGDVRTVYVDLGRYTGPGLQTSWDPRDVAGGYIAPIVPAMLDGGRADPTAENSSRSPNPAKALADEFARRIGATVGATAAVTAPQGAAVLGEVRSAPMVELVDTMLQRSDNVLAEAIGREVARVAGAETSFTGASQATLKVLRDNGFDLSGANLADASGLSGQDRVPARLLAQILSVAAGPDGKDPRTAKLRPLLGGLPVAGGSGTLADRYQTPAAAPGKGWVRAKTGTLSVPPVNSLAGVVLDTDGRLLVFALMTNGSAANTARPALDAIAAALRQCGCR